VRDHAPTLVVLKQIYELMAGHLNRLSRIVAHSPESVGLGDQKYLRHAWEKSNNQENG
jgi:hypothetical protein